MKKEKSMGLLLNGSVRRAGVTFYLDDCALVKFSFPMPDMPVSDGSLTPIKQQQGSQSNRNENTI